jgi:hypothetical protein
MLFMSDIPILQYDDEFWVCPPPFHYRNAGNKTLLPDPASLPYNLIPNLGVTQIQAHHLVVEVKGDLQGDGNCRFSSIPDTAHTRIEFKWNVQA